MVKMTMNDLNQDLTAEELQELEAAGKKEPVFDEDSRFRSAGGFVKINKVFANNLESIVLELNEYLYDDGGRIA